MNGKKLIFGISGVLIMLVLASGCSSDKALIKSIQKENLQQLQGQPAGELPPELTKIRYDLDKNRNKSAYKAVKKWLKKKDKSPYSDRALYLKARAQFQRKLYYQAFEIYEELINKHADSALFVPSLQREMAIANLFLAGAKRKVWSFIPASARTEGISILDKIAEHWPGSELAADALMTEADYYYNKGRYLEAQVTYQLVADNYQKSKHYARALLRSAESTQAQYVGPYYDTTCLTEAAYKYRQYQARFPELARKYNINERLDLIRHQQALKEFEIADFYYRTHKLSAARYYWDDIATRWKDTAEAKEAQLKLANTSYLEPKDN